MTHRCTPWIALSLLAAAGPPSMHAQHYGFGLMGHKTVTLHRRLAPDYNLHDTSFAVKVGGQGEAQRLGTIVQSEILRNGTNLQLNDKSPAVEIDCIVTSYTVPRAQVTGQAPPPTAKFKIGLGNNTPAQKLNLSGSIAVSYRALLRSNGTGLVAGQDTAKIEGSYNVAADGKHFYKSQNPTEALKIWHNTAEPIPSPEELVQQLLTDEAQRIASHVVAETQAVSVMLAEGGALDQANRRAEAGQWSAYLDALEAIPALGRPEDDAYRRYDLGVANEALAYAAEDVGSARKFLEVASTAYNKALADKPGEKLLLEPQNRIQTGMEHYAAIEKQAKERDAALAQFKQVEKAEHAQATSTAEPAPAATQETATNAPGASPSNRVATDTKAAHPSGEVMTNDSVLKLVGARFSDKMIVNKIDSTPRAQFDTSVDAMVKLKRGGVSDAVIQAMDSRMSKEGPR